MTWQRRALVAVGLAALGTSLTVPAGARAPAGTSGPCPTVTSGVTVIVDFTELGGDIEVRCAPGSSDSGLAALTAAGFTYSFVPRFPGLVCQLDSAPDPCNGAPDDAYWAYHHAPRGGDWTYSSFGAGNRTPPVGSVEGWAFGDGAEPGIAPPAKPPASGATTTTRAGSTATTRAGVTTTSGGPVDDGATGSSPTIAGDDDDSTTAADSDRDAARSDPDADADTDATTGERDGVGVAAFSDRGAGSPAGTIAGVALIGIIAGLATWKARRRPA